MTTKQNISEEEKELSDLLDRKLPKELEVFERVDALIAAGKHGEAEEILKKNKKILKGISNSVDDLKKRGEEIGKISLGEKEISKLLVGLNEKIKKITPYRKETVEELVLLGKPALLGLIEWGFSKKEVKLLLMIKDKKINIKK